MENNLRTEANAVSIHSLSLERELGTVICLPSDGNLELAITCLVYVYIYEVKVTNTLPTRTLTLARQTKLAFARGRRGGEEHTSLFTCKPLCMLLDI